MKIQCAVVDNDEQTIVKLTLLLRHDHDIDIVATCRGGIEAIKDINSLRPELIFLDLEMPEVNGFEVLNSLEYQPSQVVFMTIGHQATLKSLEIYQIEYLLKPFSDADFSIALNKTKGNIMESPQADEKLTLKLQKIINNQKVQNEMLHSDEKERLVFKSDGKVYFLDFQDVIWVEAYDYYLNIHIEGKSFLVRDKIENVMSKLGEDFIRIHKSSIVNIHYVMFIDRVLKTNEIQVVLQNGLPLNIGKEYEKKVIKSIS